MTARGRWSAAAVLLVVVAGCASTNRTAPRSAGRPAPEGQLPVASEQAAPGDEAPSPRAAPGLRTAPARPAAPGPAAPRGQGGGPLVTETTRGVDATTIRLGARYLTGGQALADQLGINGVSPGDTKGMLQAVVDYLNARGGIAGRRILPFYYPYDVANILQSQQQQQAACTAWADDHRVFAAVPAVASGTVLPTCMAQKKTPLVQDFPSWYFDDDLMGEVEGYFFTPAAPNASRGARLWVEGLASLGYLQPGARIGVVRVDSPVPARVVAEDLRPALAARGHRLVEEAAIGKPEDIGAGVLRFRAAGVTHVLVMDDGGLVGELWMNQAESQGYRPRYALSTANGPTAVLVGNVPREQLRGSVGVGWAPAWDVHRSKDPGATPQTALCLDIMQRASVDTSDRTAESLALFTCDILFFLKTAVERAASFTPEGLWQAVQALGDTYRPTGTFQARFGPHRGDGTSAARHFAFAEDCGCYAYTSQVYPAG